MLWEHSLLIDWIHLRGKPFIVRCEMRQFEFIECRMNMLRISFNFIDL